MSTFTLSVAELAIANFKQVRLKISSFLTVFLIGMFFTSVYAQTVPDPNTSCTSKDLELVGATLSGDICTACTPGAPLSRTLTLQINNTTGSTRTSFAFWGTLNIYNSDGSLKSSTAITDCVGPVPPNSITTIISSKTIDYNCGDKIVISNLFLAWTDASDNRTCPIDPATIHPKCGTLPSITVEAGVNASYVPTDVKCYGGNTGAIDLTSFGGTAPYTYSWSASNGGIVPAGQETHEDLTGLVGGTYTVTITDSKNCQGTKSIDISAPSAPLGLGSCSKTDATCAVGGSVTAGSVTNAVGTVHYSWKNNSDVVVGTTSTVNNLPAGSYTLTVSDDCSSQTCSVTVGAPAAVTVNAGDDFSKTCTMNMNGKQIGETAVSGFTYSWSPSAGLSDATASNPTANPSVTTTYTVTKTNTASGCSNTDAVTVTVDNAAVTVSAGDDFSKTCTMNMNGKQIGETAVSGFTYSWSPSAGLSDATASNPTANPSATTTYTVTKTNTASGCSNTDAVTVTVDNAAVTVSAGDDFSKTCTMNMNGKQIGETAVSGFTYSWSPAAGFSDDYSSNPTANPSVTTTYTVTKTNTASGCSNTDAVTVTVDNAAVTVSAGDDFSKTCTMNMNGKQIGETAVSGFTYSWSPSAGLSDATASNPTANPSATTTYTVTKTNTASGCSNTDAVTVTVDNAAVTVSAGDDFSKTCTMNMNGKQIGETAVSGFTYSWSPANGLSATNISNPTANPSATTTYTVTKTNTASGCSNTDAVTVTVDNAAVTVSAGDDFSKTCTMNMNGKQIGETAVSGFTYSWSPAAGLSDATASNPTANPSATTTYTVTKTNTASGCSNTDAVTVTVDNAAVTVSAGDDFSKTCTMNMNGKQIGETAVSGFTYSWSPSAGLSDATASNPTANPSATTTYTVTKTNTASGCSNTDAVTVTVDNAAVTVSAGDDFSKTCTMNMNGKQIGETAVSGFTYSWSPANGLSDDHI